MTEFNTIPSFDETINVGVENSPPSVAVGDFNADGTGSFSTAANSIDKGAWWKLDLTSGTTTADSAGTNDATYINNPTPVEAIVDNGLSFDGVDDYIKVGDNDALDFGTGDLSISTWIKTTSTGLDVLVDKRIEASGPVQGYVFAIQNGNLGFQLGDGQGFSNYGYGSSTFVADGEWHHVAVTVDRDLTDGGKFYIDGVQVATFNPTTRQGSLDNSIALTIGKRSDSSNPGHFTGSLDEVRLFDEALSATEISELHQTDVNSSFSNRVAWWKLDTTSGITAADSAGINDATYINNPTPVEAVVDDGLSFDGVDDYVEVADNDALDFGIGDLSISTWVKTADNQGTDVILDKRVEQSGAVQGYVLFTVNGKLGFQLADGSGSGFTNYGSNLAIADGQWHHVTVTVDRDNPSGGQWYLNGNLVGTFNPTGRQGSLDNSMPLTMGKRSDSSNPGYFTGSLDEVMLFDKVLSTAEVKAIYQNDTLPDLGENTGDTPGDTILTALASGLSFANPGSFALTSEIGNNPNTPPESDVDFIEFQLNAGDRVTIDIDADESGSSLDSILRLFDSTGNEVEVSDDTSAPGEADSLDSYIDFTAASTDTYYAAVSSYANFDYDPLVEGSGSGYSTGEYDLELTLISNSNDVLRGDAGDNLLHGGGGSDTLFGDVGNDTLLGGSDNDLLSGGVGDDLLNGGDGDNTFFGGNGADQFALTPGQGVDTILDFEEGIDTFLLAGGLTFGQLTINQSNNNTSIAIADSEEILATLIGVLPNGISAADFTTV
jgi:Ca2+-binding RTX toxin-like protein